MVQGMVPCLGSSDGRCQSASFSCLILSFALSDIFSTELVDRELQKRNAMLLVAQCPVNHSVLGYIFVAFTSLNVHIGKIAVRDDCRRLGIGSALIQAGWVCTFRLTKRRSRVTCRSLLLL